MSLVTLPGCRGSAGLNLTNANLNSQSNRRGSRGSSLVLARFRRPNQQALLTMLTMVSIPMSKAAHEAHPYKGRQYQRTSAITSMSCGPLPRSMALRLRPSIANPSDW